MALGKNWRISKKHDIPLHFTPSNTLRDWNNLRMKYLDMKKLTWFLLSNPETNVQICTLVRLNNHCTDPWPNTGLPTPQDKFQLSIYIKKIKDTHSKTAMLMIWPEKKAGLKENYKKPSQLNWKPLHWPERRLMTWLQSPTVLFWDPSPETSLTSNITWWPGWLSPR